MYTLFDHRSVSIGVNMHDMYVLLEYQRNTYMLFVFAKIQFLLQKHVYWVSLSANSFKASLAYRKR